MSYFAVAGHLSKNLKGGAIFTWGPFLSDIKQANRREEFGVINTE